MAVNRSMRPRHVNVEVWAPRTASWRRVSIFPGFGRFKQYLSIVLPLGIVQVKIRENRTCTVVMGHSAVAMQPDDQDSESPQA